MRLIYKGHKETAIFKNIIKSSVAPRQTGATDVFIQEHKLT